MFQLRIYTLRSPGALQRYATVHWARHVPTFETFGIATHGVWTERSGGANRLVALIQYPAGADPEDLTRRVMASPDFSADMAGFDVGDIVDVETKLLEAMPFSPIR
ncbi:NIPSNAP domain-containing protein [Mycobacterium sp. E1715]|uniref:NIPSNAP family protein n=1 Tax=Mycobacterium sp. E1715 TaxID=1856863 RepID=UPI0007FE7BCD|nr:NIPSNAP family protein [Mycobacterium sp. E1715]OBH29177.1 NIPSNAP domain-containing protein [Mycobacterium sp. E1715]